MANMKNIIRIFSRSWDNAQTLAQAEEDKEAAVQSVLDYAGYNIEEVTLDRVTLTGSGDDRLCRVDFRCLGRGGREVPACGMSWTSYVDIATGEVVGFAGTTERACVDMEEPA